ncbi:Uncharacterised protein [Legionella busanensis]|uniref:Uncharacterized protein n=1 Tax=Legionella busanensis TaxID=190655 RepID=A0A378JNT8_9GAMM|nr:hypothetical protein [Legionella busanensis]STX51953.1 Uncharacterised protein [Legionella busanensis]
MKKNDKNPAHPEVEGLENICHITPKTDSTKEVCDTLKKNKPKERKTTKKEP